MDTLTDKQTEEWTYWWTSKQKIGHTDRQTDSRIDRWTDRLTYLFREHQLQYPLIWCLMMIMSLHMNNTCLSYVHHMYITFISHVYHMYITCTVEPLLMGISNSRHLPNNEQESVHQPHFPLLQYKTNHPRADTSLLRTVGSYAYTNKQQSIQFHIY